MGKNIEQGLHKTIQMYSKYMKRHSTSLLTRETQIKIVAYTSIQTLELLKAENTPSPDLEILLLRRCPRETSTYDQEREREKRSQKLGS